MITAENSSADGVTSEVGVQEVGEHVDLLVTQSLAQTVRGTVASGPEL